MASQRVITSRSDAYDYVTTGSTAFQIVDAVALYLLETEIRGTLKTRRANTGRPYMVATAQEIDSVIKADYDINDLNKFQKDALELIENYTSTIHQKYSTEKIHAKRFLLIPVSIWHGMFGNLLTVVIVLLAYGLIWAIARYNQIDLVKIILGWFGVKQTSLNFFLT